MVRRHRLIETYLVSALGYTIADVHDDAERLEHAASDTFIERIDALLGHPTSDPHGDPIPTPEGRFTTRRSPSRRWTPHPAVIVWCGFRTRTRGTGRIFTNCAFTRECW